MGKYTHDYIPGNEHRIQELKKWLRHNSSLVATYMAMHLQQPAKAINLVECQMGNGDW